MITSLQDYINKENSEFVYIIKTINDITTNSNKKINDLVIFLQKYNLISISSIKKTPIQKLPMDFPSFPNSEVWIIKVVLGMPVSNYVLLKEIINIWEVTESSVIVRNEYDPGEKYNYDYLSNKELNEKIKKFNYKKSSLLDTKENFYKEETKGTDYFGNKYNELFKQYLNKNRKNPYPNFNVSYNNKDEYDFLKSNDMNTPEIYSFGKKENNNIIDNKTEPVSRWGNFWYDIVNYYKPYESLKNKEKNALQSSYKIFKNKKD